MEMLSLLAIVLAFIVSIQSNITAETSSLTLVGTNGTDEPKCLDGGTSQPCLNLTYVFTNVHHLACDNCTVLVTYRRHEINTNSYGYNLTYHQNLTIIGINSTIIVMKDGRALQFFGNGSSMSIKGIYWYICGTNPSGDSFFFNFEFEFYKVEIESCTFNCSIIFLSVLHVVINNSAFHNINNTDIAVIVEVAKLEVLNSVFKKNHGTLINLFGQRLVTDVNICNCTFEDNIAPSFSLIRSVVFYIQEFNINLASNNFTSNRGNLINLRNYGNYEGISCYLEKLNFYNKTANHFGLVYIHSLNIRLISTNFTENSLLNPDEIETGIIHVYNSFIEIENCVFVRNKNTPLSLQLSKAQFTGENTFDTNFALKGGGISADQKSSITVFQYGKITFTNNLAYYGGAIYIGQNNAECVLNSTWEEAGSYVFLDNKAITEGSSIYSSIQWCDCFQNLNLTFNEKLPIVSSPTVIKPILTQTIKLFPGQLIVLQDWNVTDCAGNSSSCTANVLLLCSICDAKSFNLQLIGQPTVLLFNGTIETGLRVTASIEKNNINVQLHFQCRGTSPYQLPVQQTIPVEMTLCPLGLKFNSSARVCQCEHHNSKLLCSDQLGIACIEKGYWYGPVISDNNNSNTKYSVEKCTYCKYSTRDLCPSQISTSSSDFVLLGQTLDDQCEDGRGGILCMKCTDGNTFTFGAIQCITNEHCESWHPYLLLTLNILSPFITGVFLVIMFQIKTNTGSGYLYGPLFFLAVLSQLPLSDFLLLRKITSIFVALILLRFDIFGYIPWCFFPSINHLYATSLEFIGPIVVGIVVIGAIYSAKHCPRIFLTLQKSPVQVICLLIIVSVWSLASTSMRIIIPIQFNDVMVALNPEMQYLREAHIPLWIISVTVLLFLVIFALLLVVSPSINLHRIKPFLDEFQSCYQDKYRWYAGVYVCSWMILLIAIALSDYILLLTSLAIIATAQYLVQPYRTKWLNNVDTLLLTDLTFLTGLLLLQDKVYAINFLTEKTLLVYFLVMSPLCYIGIGIVSIILVCFGIRDLLKRLFHRCYVHTEQQVILEQSNIDAVKRDQLPIQRELMLSGEREPLLRIIQDDR